MYKTQLVSSKPKGLCLYTKTAKFSNMKGFYGEVESKMTSGLNWKIGWNFNALNDLLYGGLGVLDVDEKYILKWY